MATDEEKRAATLKAALDKADADGRTELVQPPKTNDEALTRINTIQDWAGRERTT